MAAHLLVLISRRPVASLPSVFRFSHMIPLHELSYANREIRAFLTRTHLRLPAVRHTVKTRINGPCVRTLDLPLLVRSAFFLLFLLSRGACFWRVSPPFPEISDYTTVAHGPIIRVFTVL